MNFLGWLVSFALAGYIGYSAHVWERKVNIANLIHSLPAQCFVPIMVPEPNPLRVRLLANE